MSREHDRPVVLRCADCIVVEERTSMGRLVFDSSSLAETEQFLSASYAPLSIGSSTEQMHAHVDRLTGPAVSIDRLDLAFEMSYVVDPLGKLCLCSIERGGIADHRVDGWRTAESYGPGEVFSFTPPDRSYRGEVQHAAYTITMLDPAVLRRVAGDAEGEDDQTPRLLDHHAVTLAAAAELGNTIRFLRSVLSGPSAAADRLVHATAVDHLAARILATFPNTAVAPSAGQHSMATAAVRRAQTYIADHADADISVADIAGAANVTVRALQYGFRRHLDTTPMRYLRQVRLERARRDLSAADPEGDDTVTGIARRWGFANHSRFSARYRAAFGEPPSRTLRRS